MAAEPSTGIARTLLCVPGDQRARLGEVFGCGADELIVDFEDAVPAQSKAIARDVVADWMQHNAAPADRIWLRFNADTPAEDAETISAPLAGVMVPRAEITLLARVDELFTAREVRLGIESGGPEFRSILFALVIASSAAGIMPPLAPTSTDYRDLEALRVSTENIIRLGFRSRTAVHPAQRAVINEVFTPAPEEVQRAIRLVAAFEDAEHSDSGDVVGEDGRDSGCRGRAFCTRCPCSRASQCRGRRLTGVTRVPRPVAQSARFYPKSRLSSHRFNGSQNERVREKFDDKGSDCVRHRRRRRRTGL